MDPARGALKGPGFWRHLRAAYGHQLPGYQARISGIITACHQQDIDIVLFPACTAIWRYHTQLERYRQEIRKLRCAIFGCLKVSPSHCKEHSEIWAHGHRLMKLDSRWPIAVKLAGIPSVIAQSSTIKVVYQAPFLTLPSDRLPATPPYRLALDLGHGQYQGRYRRVFRKLRSMGMDAVLSFWRNQQGQTNYHWVEARSRYTLERHELPHGDYLDLLEFH